MVVPAPIYCRSRTRLRYPTCDSDHRQPSDPCGFYHQALMPGDSGQTRISGVVLDNQDRPMPQVTVRIEGSTRQAVTNADGQFRIEQAPVGPVHLIVEGSTTTRSGEWPSLGYHLITVPGVDNLCQTRLSGLVDTQHAVRVGEQDAWSLRYSILYPRHPRRLRYLSRWQQKRLSFCHLDQCQQSAHATANGSQPQIRPCSHADHIRSAGKTHLTQTVTRHVLKLKCTVSITTWKNLSP